MEVSRIRPSSCSKKIKNVLALYAPDWNQCPEGELASHWAIDNPQSVCFLIWIAQVLYKLDCAKTEKSVNVFAEKIKQLMKLNLYQLTEALRELEIGAALSERFSPISFEPYVPVDNTYDSKPISPDYGIKLPEGWVDIESTVFRLGKLQSWDKKYLVS